VAAARVGNLFSRQLQMRSSRLGLASRGQQTPENLAAQLLSPQWRNERLDQIASHASPVRPVEGGWLQMQQVSVSETRDSLIGNAAWQLEGNALSLGVDGYWRENLIVGAGAGTVQGDISFDNRSASGDFSAIFAGLYTRWDQDALHLKAALSSARSDIGMQRRSPVSPNPMTSEFQVSSTVFSSEAGYGLHVASYGVRPFIRFNAATLDRDAFSEDGGTGAELDVRSSRQRGGEFGIGVELSRPWLMSGNRWAQLQGSVALLDQYGDVAVSQQAGFAGTTPGFEVRSASEKDWITEYGLGGEFYIASNSALWIGLHGRQTDNGSETQGLIGFSLRW
jgi:uncharacterized protein with beta-barrel porin domain